MNQYVINSILQRVRLLLNNAGVGQRNYNVYKLFLEEVNNPNTQLFQSLVAVLNSATMGNWTNGLNDQDKDTILRPWINNTLSVIDAQLRQQQGGMFQGNMQPQQQAGFGYAPPPPQMNIGHLYDSPTDRVRQTQTMPPIVNTAIVPTYEPQQPTEVSMQSFNDDKATHLTLVEKPSQVQNDDTSILIVDDYMEDDRGSTRVSMASLSFRVAENNSYAIAEKLLRYMPSNIIRGAYANIVNYQEIHYIPMRSADFKRIAELLLTESGMEKESSIRNNGWWRNVVSTMGKLTRADYKAIESVFLSILNPLIFKFLRTSKGANVIGIEEIDDLRELDNPRSKLVVTQHSSYLSRLNAIVSLAFQTILDPRNLILAEDEYIGDFIHCEHIEFYHDGRSKYDYGTFDKREDRLAFIQEMMARHTVLRIPRKLIITNAFNARMIDNIYRFSKEDQFLIKSINHVGCELLTFIMSNSSNSIIDHVICIDDTSGSGMHKRQINTGCTLDGDLVLTP